MALVSCCFVIRRVYACVVAVIDWSLMLVCMTFNAGIFCAVIVGVATGRALTGGYLARGEFEVSSCQEFPCCDDRG